jgi:predicted transposase YdaD
MLGIELSQTRVYQDAKVEGKIEGENRMVILQLNHRVGDIPIELLRKISQLPIEKLEELGKALLDFNTLNDLGMWLALNQTKI